MHSGLKHRINAARVAVEEQVPFFKAQFGAVHSEWKEDDTRVTFVDFAISENIFSALRKDFPEDDYCSEESGNPDEIIALEAKYGWLLDPIDGTNNYALGFTSCAIALALLRHGEPIYGFIYDLSTGSLYEGGNGFGLFMNKQKIRPPALSLSTRCTIGAHFPMPAGVLDKLEPLLARHRIRSLGSGALNLAYVAVGKMEGCFDMKVKAWDIGASMALLEAAGLSIHFLNASPFPLRQFSTGMDLCPYYAGIPEFCDYFKSLQLEHGDGEHFA